MSKSDTIIIDTGCANLSSVRYAFERIGADVEVSDDIDKIKAATRVVLPGVGTARAAMKALKDKKLIDTICSLTQPVLGVCLGMQMLTKASQERGGLSYGNSSQNCQCLGLIDTNIEQLDAKGLPLPHMGWNQISPGDHPLFAGVAEGCYVYFVHSYRAPLGDFTIAKCEYGEGFSAAIAKDNFMGVQFHPEKSAAVGATILRNFMKMNAGSFAGNHKSTQESAQ
ncbi:imidazole glycerol phosphate synthase subunit HisH [Shewanella alkalitolerans]|uniref:imidazole glycerol phosphate synthase subunit HisH n=1 Tax=Shewanella alkalitolerans TaxID=2864209 RepID=UPI001C660124|nr:imidazole glycerol phosphate synthase subunit HisH [Shewanella alkalitolerans]QYJ96143.1 imidazole glycerol phosphate synthase subunit HisH [Shewanella alkalitolerans]